MRRPTGLLRRCLVSGQQVLLALAATASFGEPRFSEPDLLPGPVPDGAVLDLAFIAEDRALLLSTGSLTLLRLTGDRLESLAEHSLPGPLRPVRFPAGRLLPNAEGSAAWVLTSQMSRALLFAVDSGLAQRAEADALPWPGADRGLRYRDGTNLLEGSLGPLGAGPFLAVAHEPGLALRPDGTAIGPAQAPPLGAPIESAWPDLLVCAGARPPEQPEQLLAVGIGPISTWSVLARRPVPGPIRALAVRTGNDQARLLLALETPAGPRLAAARLTRAP